MKRALVWVAIVALVLLGHFFGGKNLRGALDALPALIAALVGWLFARTLAHGRAPLIAMGKANDTRIHAPFATHCTKTMIRCG